MSPDAHAIQPAEDTASAVMVAATPPLAPDDLTQEEPEIHTLRARIAHLDTSLAAAEQSNVELETRHANLSATLAHVQRELAELSASSKFIAAAKEAVDKELAAEKRRRELAEETVDVLRGKVDDARKAFGTMQKQDKRASTLGGGVPGVETLSLDALGFTDDTTKPNDPPSSVRTNTHKSKRTSMLVGRRSSNASDQPDPASLLLSPPQVGSILTTPVLPQAPINAQGLRELRLATGGTSAWSATGMPLSPGGGGAGSGSGAATTTNAQETDPAPTSSSSSSSNRWSSLNFGSAGVKSSPGKPTSRGLKEAEDPVEELDHPVDLARPAPASHRISSSSITSARGTTVDLTATPPLHNNQPTDNADRSSIPSLHAEIIQLRSQLVESQEARAASEECLKALREFIASGGPSRAAGTDADDAQNGGIEGIKLPPLPTDRDPEDDRMPLPLPQSPPPQKRTTSSGWGLGLWRSSPNPASVPAPATTSQGASTSTPGPSAASSPALGIVPVPNADEHGSST
ncbi:hypothetical protein NliqN6_4650 [Naganishia liquefaciens]|uniref:Uncharacterized protein n=1 Tax=Naganishia liquefaciens TaxID=104408 RepID=A0A8H3TWQ9_9TREE|nr:hypothetical protein NliqN6_4650 [Naganishia liquefaciens]